MVGSRVAEELAGGGVDDAHVEVGNEQDHVGLDSPRSHHMSMPRFPG